MDYIGLAWYGLLGFLATFVLGKVIADLINGDTESGKLEPMPYDWED